MAAIRRALMIFGAAVSILFASVFVMSFWSDKIINATAKAVIRHRIVAMTGAPLNELTNSTIVEKAKQVLQENEKFSAFLNSMAAGKFRDLIDKQLDRLSDSRCECRIGNTKVLTSILAAVATALEREQLVLKEMIRTKYLEFESGFAREVRIFSGTNLVIGLLILFAALVKRKAGVHLILPAILLSVTLAIGAFAYIFNQNWLHAILFRDFVGFAYVGYVSMLFLWLCDVILNSAHVTSHVLNVLGSSLGGLFHVSPC